MKTKTLLLSTCALILLATLATIARADPVVLTLPPSVVVQAGGSVGVIGTLENQGAPPFNISSWSINLSNALLTLTTLASKLASSRMHWNRSGLPTSLTCLPMLRCHGNYAGTFTVMDTTRNLNVTQTFVITVTPQGQQYQNRLR